MALPLPPGLTPAEVAFLCEMELVTVLPRQRLESLDLLGGRIPALNPPHRSNIPLWLALLLKRQGRANITPPPWMLPDSLKEILQNETEISKEAFSPPPRLPRSTADTTSPPFLASATVDTQDNALPYHWLELGEILLEAAPDDFQEPDQVKRLMRDLREVRLEKLRAGVKHLEGGHAFKMNGVGGMEVAEGRAFIAGVIDELRKIGSSREQSRREREAEERENGGYADTQDDYDDDMDI